MGFNADAFAAATFEPRTEVVEFKPAFEGGPAHALAEFFGEGETPAFTVRGLTANELCKATEARDRQGQLDAVVKAIASQKVQVEAIRKALGMTGDTPGEVARRMEMLVLGCVEPKMTHAIVAKFAEIAPIEFYDITNKITLLTGQGGSRSKPLPSSQETPAS